MLCTSGNNSIPIKVLFSYWIVLLRTCWKFQASMFASSHTLSFWFFNTHPPYHQSPISMEAISTQWVSLWVHPSFPCPSIHHALDLFLTLNKNDYFSDFQQSRALLIILVCLTLDTVTLASKFGIKFAKSTNFRSSCKDIAARIRAILG